MKANYENKINPQAEVSLGNLYDMNKQLMEQSPAIDQSTLASVKPELETWFMTFFNQKYFMLLCHELRDYTLFNLDKTSSWKTPSELTISNAASDIIECLSNRGTILAIEKQDAVSWELWIRTEDGCFAYYLFPYGEAVLEY